jgi:hypothetical protein
VRPRRAPPPAGLLSGPVLLAAQGAAPARAAQGPAPEWVPRDPAPGRAPSGRGHERSRGSRQPGSRWQLQWRSRSPSAAGPRKSRPPCPFQHRRPPHPHRHRRSWCPRALPHLQGLPRLRYPLRLLRGIPLRLLLRGPRALPLPLLSVHPRPRRSHPEPRYRRRPRCPSGPRHHHRPRHHSRHQLLRRRHYRYRRHRSRRSRTLSSCG